MKKIIWMKKLVPYAPILAHLYSGNYILSAMIKVVNHFEYLIENIFPYQMTNNSEKKKRKKLMT